MGLHELNIYTLASLIFWQNW